MLQTASTYMYAVEFKYGSKKIVFQDNVIPSNVDDVYSDTHCCTFHSHFLYHHFQAERVCDCYIRIYKKGQENVNGKRILNFLGNIVSEEQDGSVSNRESFQEAIVNQIESFDRDQESFA